jgi:menaquinol-cytochrome c reductase cytochrome b/c subunit
VIVGLAFLWHYTSILGPPWTDKADPGTTSFVPRPDWYFYFLFYLLRIFKWPDSVVLGTVGVPTIALILLLVIPFVDLRRERRLLRRPVAIVTLVLVALSMGVLTYKGATAKEALGAELESAVPGWVKQQKLPQDAVPGAKLFARSGCLNCHTYLSVGGSQLGAPNLTAEGSKNKGVTFQIEHLKCPSCVNKGSPMPSFAAFPEADLRRIAVFLEASKGPK